MNRFALPATLFLVVGAAAQEIDSPPLVPPPLSADEPATIPTIPAPEAADPTAPAMVEPASAVPAQVDAAVLEPAQLIPQESVPAIQSVQLPPDDAEEQAAAAKAEAPLEVPVPRPTDGFFQAPGLMFPSFADLRKGLRLGASASMVYDSNVNPGFGGSQDEGDLIFNIGPNLTYKSFGSDIGVAATLGVNYAAYLDNSDLGGLGYNAALSLSYDGNPLIVRGGFSSGRSTGTNQNYGAYSETVSHQANLSASYRISPKTNLNATMGYNWTDPNDATASNGTTFGQTENFNFDLAAMWQATPLVTIGPGIAWSWNSGQLQGERESIGPIVRGTYQLARKVSLNGTLGYEFVDYSGVGGRSDTSVTGSLGAAYQASPLWSMNLTLHRGTSADGAGFGSYRETTSLRLAYIRKILDASLSLGGSYEVNDSVQTSSVVAGGGTVGDTFSLNASVSMPVFADRASLSVFTSWRDQSGGTISGGDGYRAGVSLSAAF